MKDFLGNKITIGNKIVISAYGEYRELRNGFVEELHPEKGESGYVGIKFYVNDKLTPYVDYIEPQYLVVVDKLIPATKTGAVSLFDLQK